MGQRFVLPVKAIVVYRLFDADHKLCYIGVSRNVWDRIGTHALGGRYAYVAMETFATWEEAYTEEQRLIKALRPIDNRTWRGRAPLFRSYHPHRSPIPSPEIRRVVEDWLRS